VLCNQNQLSSYENIVHGARQSCHIFRDAAFLGMGALMINEEVLPS